MATPNGTSIDLSWLPVAGASQYDIFLSTSPNVSTTSYTLETVTTDTSAVVTGLTIGSTYYVVVAAGSVYGFAVGPSSAVISVQLTGNPSSSAPVITAISASPSIASAGSLVLFAVSASDSDGDTLTYTWSVNGGTVAGPTANLNQYNWTASATTGTYTVGVQVSDGTTTVSASTTVTVQ